MDNEAVKSNAPSAISAKNIRVRLYLLARRRPICVVAALLIMMVFYFTHMHDVEIIVDDVAEMSTRTTQTNTQIVDSAWIKEEEGKEDSCFRPKRNNNFTSKAPLLGPFINLGMPKMGSTSIHSYFRCGGYKSVHWICDGNTTNGTFCGDCIEESIKAGLPPLSKCPTVDSYAQIDRGPENMVQVNYLDEIVSGIPNATFIMTFRNMTKWYISMSNWIGIAGQNKTNNMRARFERQDIKGLPAGVGKNLSEFSKFYCDYVKRVRETVAKYPGHELVEIDIEDPKAGWRMEEAFGVKHDCWGKTNIRVNSDEVSVDELHR